MGYNLFRLLLAEAAPTPVLSGAEGPPRRASVGDPVLSVQDKCLRRTEPALLHKREEIQI